MVCGVMKGPAVSPGEPAVLQAPGVPLDGRSPSVVRRMVCAVSHSIDCEVVVAVAAVGAPSQDQIKAILIFEKSHRYAGVA